MRKALTVSSNNTYPRSRDLLNSVLAPSTANDRAADFTLAAQRPRRRRLISTESHAVDDLKEAAGRLSCVREEKTSGRFPSPDNLDVGSDMLVGNTMDEVR